MSNLPGQFPMTIVNDYYEKMQEHIEVMEDDLEKALNHRLGRILKRFDGASEDLEKQLSRLREEHGIDEKEAKGMAKDMANKTKNNSIRQVDKQVEGLTGVKPYTSNPNLREEMNVFVQENVRLIKTIPDKYHDDVERVIREGAISGKSTQEITEEVDMAGRKTTNNAKLIARDQVGKFFGETTKARHQQLGFENFEWRTAGDDRVRDSHEGLDGNVYTWEEGANGLFPGMDIQCRCIALPTEKEAKGQMLGEEVEEPPEPQQVVGGSGEINREQLEEITDGMDFEEAYRYKMKVANASSEKRVFSYENLDLIEEFGDEFNPKMIDYDTLSDGDLEVIYTIKNKTGADQGRGKLIRSYYKSDIDDFNNLNSLREQQEYVRNHVNDKLERLASPTDKADYNAVKSLMEDHIQMGINEQSDGVIRDLLLKREFEINRRQNEVRGRYDFGTVAVDSEVEDAIQEAENFFRSYAHEDFEMPKTTKAYFAPSKERAYALSNQRKVYLTSNSDYGTAVHEMAHVVHRNSSEEVERVVGHFFSERTAGTPLTRIYAGKDEWGHDAFIDHYDGKVYDKDIEGKKGTEILSMGYQRMFENPVNFYQEDRGYFDLCYAILKGLF